jgi:hypothetical protein
MAATVNSDNVRATSVVMHRYLRTSVLEKKRASLDRWQDRVRDPSLTVLLVLQLFLLFVALPLAATGVPIAAPVAWLLLLVAVTLVVLLSQKGVAIVIILLGLACAAASFAFGRQWSPITASVLNHGGFILAFSALTWVVAHALYAPGRITFHRLQGAMVVYLSLATIFANAFGLVWGLIPDAYAYLPPAAPRRERIRDDALFQSRDTDHDRLWRHRAAQPVRAQPGQFGIAYRAILSCHHGRPPRDDGTRRPAPQPRMSR